MSDTDKLKLQHNPVLTDSLVPIGLLRKPQGLEAMPYEMQIIKTLVLGKLASPAMPQSESRLTRFSTHCCTYQVASPLITHYVHYYDEDRLQVRYKMGFTDTYVNMPKSMVSPLVSGNHNTALLLEYVTKFTPVLHPVQFLASCDQQRRPTHIASMKSINRHIPSGFRTYVEELLSMKSIVVTVVPPRKSKCGDHRRLPSGEHHISVNETDNSLGFMLTLLHEFAHALAPRTNYSTPHDKYWKLMFANLMVDCFGFFPPELAAYITLLACNPPSSKDIIEDHMVRNCLLDGFKEQSLSRIDLLRAMTTLDQRLGVN